MLVFTGIVCSFATLPYVWFIFPYLIENQTLYVITAELFAVVVETIIYYYVFKYTHKLSLKNSFVLSFLCNLASFLVGVLIFTIVAQAL